MCSIIKHTNWACTSWEGEIMDNILEGLKDVVKEGVDLTELESKLKGLNPLSSVETKEDAWEFIKKNPVLISTFDQKQSERAKTVEENIMNGKFQEALKAKEAELREQLIPNETEAQKVAREFKEYKQQQEAKESLSIIQEKLLKKASETGFDPLFARELAVYGEDAEAKFDTYNEFIQKEVDKRLAEALKARFPGEQQPKSSTPVNGLSEMTDAQLYDLVRTSPDQKTAVLSEIKRRTKPKA